MDISQMSSPGLSCVPPHLREQVSHPSTAAAYETATRRKASTPKPTPLSHSAFTPALSMKTMQSRTWPEETEPKSSAMYEYQSPIHPLGQRQPPKWVEKDGKMYELTSSWTETHIEYPKQSNPSRRVGQIVIIAVTAIVVLMQVFAYFGPGHAFNWASWDPPHPALVRNCKSFLDAPENTYTGRIEALVSALPASTAWIAEPGPSASYFLGRFSSADWHLSERPFLVVIGPNPTDNITFLTPAFEALRASLISLPEEVAGRARFIQWKEDENPYEVLHRHIGKVDFVLDGQVREAVAAGLRKVLREETDDEVKSEIGLIRERKDARELNLLQCANEFTLHAIRQTRRRMYFGITESQTSRILEEEMAATGLVGGEGLVLFGENAALPHGSGTDRALGKEDLILIDAGGKWGGYVSDITRTFALPKSKIPQKHIELWETVRQAQYAPFELLKSSNITSPPQLGELDKAARAVITAKYGSAHMAGSKPDFSLFTHRLGHGIGLEGHEAPYLVQGPVGEKTVQAGHVFSLEPGVYIPASSPEVKGLRGVGVRLEDCFYVTEDAEGRLGGGWLSGPVGQWGDI